MNDLVLANTKIRQDVSGRFSLNDLHRASGGANKHRPGHFTRTDNFKALVEELETAHICAVSAEGGRAGGTYVAKELVYAYAMWISPRFHLQVIRAYDVLVNQNVDPMAVLKDPENLRALLLDYGEKVLGLKHQVLEQAPKVEAYDRLSDAKGAFGIRESAKVIGMPEKLFVAWLRKHGWLFRGTDGRLQAYHNRLRDRFMVHVIKAIPIESGHEKVVMTVRITPRGLAKLAAIIPVSEGKAALTQALVH